MSDTDPAPIRVGDELRLDHEGRVVGARVTRLLSARRVQVDIAGELYDATLAREYCAAIAAAPPSTARIPDNDNHGDERT